MSGRATPTNYYHFVSHWRMKGDIARVYELLTNPLGYSRWWKNSNLRVEQLEAGNAEGVNQVVRCQMDVKGWLSYTIKWQLRCAEANKPYHFASEATGDFVGRGVWSFKQNGPWVDITFDWNVSAEKLFFRYFSFLLKPFFVAKHDQIMKKWEESLREELMRRNRIKVLD